MTFGFFHSIWVWLSNITTPHSLCIFIEFLRTHIHFNVKLLISRLLFRTSLAVCRYFIKSPLTKFGLFCSHLSITLITLCLLLCFWCRMKMKNVGPKTSDLELWGPTMECTRKPEEKRHRHILSMCKCACCRLPSSQVPGTKELQNAPRRCWVL